MKWFKHLAGSLKDSIIFDAVELFGSDAYMVFFGTLELLADEFDETRPGIARISIKKMTSFFQISRQKTVRILQHFDQIAIKDPTKKRAFLATIEKDFVTINCPRFVELLDNHTNNTKGKTCKLVVSDSQETLTQEVEAEADIDSKEKDLKAPPSIEILEPETGTLDPEEVERTVIMDMAITMVNDTTIEIANLLSQDGFKKTYAWIQRQRNLHMNPRAILHTLRQCQKYHPDNPWSYCSRIIEIENGNFNERDSIRNHT